MSDASRASKKELKEHFNAFLRFIPERVKELAALVNQSAGFERWKPDCTAESLEHLGDWLESQIDTRPRSQDELERIRSASEFPVEVSGRALTKHSLSLAMDVGIYLSEVLVCNHRCLKWELPLGSKRFIDYGKPVLSGFNGSATMNPTHVATVFAIQLRRGKQAGKHLKHLYYTWSQMVPYDSSVGRAPKAP